MEERVKIYRAIYAAFVVLGLAFIFYGTFRVVGVNFGGGGDQTVTFDVRIIENRWIWDPDYIEVPQGANVVLNITNNDGYDHGFAVNELNVNQRLPANQVTTVEFVATRAGEFTFRCSVYCGSGHFDQIGTLVVLGDGSGPVGPVVEADAPDLPTYTFEDRVERLDYVEEDDVKVFQLTADEFMWDYGNGEPIQSWGYNNQLSGPEIRVVEGETVRIEFTNNLPVPTSVHWHGIDLINRMDGVPGYTQPPVDPGETFTYEFVAYPAGTRFYHTHGSHHGDEGEQMNMGLAGPLVVLPRDYEEPDVDVTWVLTERIQYGLFPINGAIYPEIDFLRVQTDDRVRVRMINAGSSTFHPMHLHGHQFRVVSVDGNPVPEAAQLTRNTLPILPGETYDVEFIANNPGLWLFHCHELNHVAGGMISAVIYDDYIAGGYELVNPSGDVVSDTDFLGQYSLVSFGYTNCADKCPTTMVTLRMTMDSLGDLASEVQPILITVDPERDTPERMGAYTAAFDERILGLTGSQEQIARAADTFKTDYRIVPNDAGDDYSVDHTGVMFLMGPDGKYVTHFDHHTSPDTIARTIRRRIEERGGQQMSLGSIRGR
jgi:cytochrome oxidase Cu insertion factor (SCO1/SenC/PrrC family)